MRTLPTPHSPLPLVLRIDHIRRADVAFLVPLPSPSPADRRAAFDALERDTHDVLVIGGGITGAGIARDAALRGMAVALIEREDFASGTSSRSSRLIHGGVRYLEHGYFALVFESSAERRRLLQLAPHLVRPLPFTWPVYRGARVPRWKLLAGLTLYDALALFRNVAMHRPLGPEGVLAREPALRKEHLTGGARYFDAATDDARLTLANALGAATAGTIVLNHATVTSLLLEGGTVHGAMVTDAETGRSVAARARVVVNATGPWTDAIHRFELPDAPPMVRGTKGVHIAVPRHRVGNREAITLLSDTDGRVMFVLPAGEHAIIGTTDTETRATPAEVRANESDIAYLLGTVNHFFPGARLRRADVVSAWAGIRPLIASGFDATPASASREHQLSWTPGGVLAMSGGKLTTYRTMAAEALDAITQRLGRPPMKSLTADRPLPGGDLTSLADVVAEATTRIGSASRAVHLVHSYGSQWKEVWMLAEDDPSLGRELVPGLPCIRAEVVYGVAREAARTLGDVLIRRTKVAFETRDQGRGAAEDAAGLVAPLLKWNEERRRSALLEYEREISRMFAVDPDPRLVADAG